MQSSSRKPRPNPESQRRLGERARPLPSGFFILCILRAWYGPHRVRRNLHIFLHSLQQFIAILLILEKLLKDAADSTVRAKHSSWVRNLPLVKSVKNAIPDSRSRRKLSDPVPEPTRCLAPKECIMEFTSILAALAIFPAVSIAQSSIPIGTLIPVVLNRSLKADRVHSGQEFRAEVMQDIPGTPIHRRSNLLGHIVATTPSKNGPSTLVLSFDAAQVRHRRIPLKVNLRAIASFVEVNSAQVPEDMAERGTTPETATTQQIGGDQVYRGGGPVAVGDTAVGRPTAYGVLGLPRTQPGESCRGVVGVAIQPQAFWLFSTDACGVYGLSRVRIVHAGRTDPVGIITLGSDNGKLTLSSGSGMLLRVQGS